MAKEPLKVGLLVGREWSFPPAFIEEVNHRRPVILVQGANLAQHAVGGAIARRRPVPANTASLCRNGERMRSSGLRRMSRYLAASGGCRAVHARSGSSPSSDVLAPRAPATR